MTARQVRHPAQMWLLAFLFAIASLLVLSLLGEGVGWLALRSSAHSSIPFLFNAKAAQSVDTDYFDSRDSFAWLDPHLSHAHDPEHLKAMGYNVTPGFVTYDSGVSGDALKIVVLGGSTSDPALGYSWPELLAGVLKERGAKATVLNGGVAGYSSNQELIKLTRDVLPLGPDIVISMSGVNDLV